MTSDGIIAVMIFNNNVNDVLSTTEANISFSILASTALNDGKLASFPKIFPIFFNNLSKLISEKGSQVILFLSKLAFKIELAKSQL